MFLTLVKIMFNRVCFLTVKRFILKKRKRSPGQFKCWCLNGQASVIWKIHLCGTPAFSRMPSKWGIHFFVLNQVMYYFLKWLIWIFKIIFKMRIIKEECFCHLGVSIVDYWVETFILQNTVLIWKKTLWEQNLSCSHTVLCIDRC